ncbi:UNVERIFIED_CONTAM: hypothetical protein K2H54_038946 [Gekko kuhli]
MHVVSPGHLAGDQPAGITWGPGGGGSTGVPARVFAAFPAKTWCRRSWRPVGLRSVAQHPPFFDDLRQVPRLGVGPKRVGSERLQAFLGEEPQMAQTPELGCALTRRAPVRDAS